MEINKCKRCGINKNWIDDISFRPDNFIKKDKKSRVKALASAINIDIDKYDEDNRLKVVELAQEHGYQGIFEIATKNKSADGDVPTFLIEDGEAVEANQEVVA